MIVFLPVCAFEVYWCLLYAVLMSASTGSCSKPCSLCKEIQHPDVMVCILLHMIYLTCKARSSYRLLGSAVDFSQQTVPMSCYSWSNCTSPTHKSCWSTYWVVQKKPHKVLYTITFGPFAVGWHCLQQNARQSLLSTNQCKIYVTVINILC